MVFFVLSGCDTLQRHVVTIAKQICNRFFCLNIRKTAKIQLQIQYNVAYIRRQEVTLSVRVLCTATQSPSRLQACHISTASRIQM